MESFGGTFGKKVAKIRTINIHTNKVPSIAQTIKRSAIIVVPMFIVLILNAFYQSMNMQPQTNMGSGVKFTFMSFLVLIVYLLPFLAMLWSPTKQCWHDKFSKIAIIKMTT